MNQHFSMPFNFCALPKELSDYKKSRVAILPVPFDATTTYQPGTRNGPLAIIDASRSLEAYDEELGRDISSIGICTLEELEVVDDSEKTAARVYESVQSILADGKKALVIGGEHSISSGSVKAHLEIYPDLTVLHIDAHADMRDDFSGNRHNHACVARRISEMCPLVSVGVRSISEEEIQHIRDNAGRIKAFFAKDICQRGNDEWMEQAISHLGRNVYVTIDLDALDPSIMPSVGTPQPGGLEWYQLLEFLRRLAGSRNVVGFDLTELMPIPGNHAPDLLAAKLAYKLIGYFFSRE